MLTDHLIAWLLYLVASLGIVFLFWRMTRGLHRVFKRILRVLAVSILFTPHVMLSGGSWLAPAYLVAGYELAKGNLELAGTASLSILGFMAFLTLLVFLESVFRRLGGLEKA